MRKLEYNLHKPLIGSEYPAYRPIQRVADGGKAARNHRRMDPRGRAERLLPSMQDGEGSSLKKAGVCMYAVSGREMRQAGWHRRSYKLLSLQIIVET